MAKPKITKTTTPKAPKTKITRVDNTEWKNSSPAAGGEQSWSEWAKSNPNRAANAQQRKKEFEKVPTTMTKAGSKERKEMVQKWKAARPVSGKGGAKSDADKEAKRQKQIAWAKHNPNKLTNANRAMKGK
jgi:hypothetical protein